MNYGDLKRPVLVRMAHEQFGPTIDPIHTPNAVIVSSLEAGTWQGANVGQVSIVQAAAPVPNGATQVNSVKPAAPIMPTAGADLYVDRFDLKALIPSPEVLTSYLPRKLDGRTDLDVIEIAIRNNRNVLLVGDAGTGKNHLSEAVAAKLQRPLVAVNLSGGTTVEDIVGQYLFIGGSTVWSDGILTAMMRHGGILVLDEINACPPEISFVLHQVLDWRRTLVLVQKGKEVIKAHKDFAIVGTMNPDYRGTRPLNEAFRDRFQVTVNLDYDDAVESKLIKSKPLIKLSKQLRAMYRDDYKLSIPCSTRMLLDYQANAGLFGEHIARECLIARYDIKEQPPIREAIKLHLDGATSNVDSELV